jgi:hypothetical protein
MRILNLLKRNFSTIKPNKFKNMSKVEATVKNVFVSEDIPHKWGEVLLYNIG